MSQPRPAGRQSAALVTIAVLSIIAGACSAPDSSDDGSASAPTVSPIPDAAALTAYDPATPLDVAEESAVRTLESGVEIHDISWASLGSDRVSAWLVLPPGDGPFAGLVYLHGSETDRDDFLDEAVAMALGGAASVVLDAPFARAGSSRKAFLLNFGLAERERDMTAQAVLDARRAYDVLLERGDVDPERLGFVGHSWGASLGVVLAAVDERPGSLVIITARPSWTGFLAAGSEGWVRSAHERVGEEDWQQYLSLMAPLDATAEIDNVDGGRLYLQYGTADDVVPEDVSVQLIDAAQGAKSDLYPAPHALNDDATADRVRWLVERLGLAPIGDEALGEVGLPDQPSLL
ncbi:MAG TPA: acetylxylan esterase [Candidatus Limnocylindria bacterium]|nr:acetylxylan esterase [Candidatus Limnocylindria bacterium]